MGVVLSSNEACECVNIGIIPFPASPGLHNTQAFFSFLCHACTTKSWIEAGRTRSNHNPTLVAGEQQTRFRRGTMTCGVPGTFQCWGSECQVTQMATIVALDAAVPLHYTAHHSDSWNLAEIDPSPGGYACSQCYFCQVTHSEDGLLPTVLLRHAS